MVEKRKESSSRGKALVIGGSGFVGSHIADALTAAGYGVRIFDLRESPYRTPDQEFVRGDIMDLEALTEAAKGCRYVYNFAGMADLEEAKDNPIGAARLNVLGNVHALEAARRAEAERFIYASTVYVYSGAGAFYRASKQAAEHFVETYHERFGLSFTILRYGSLYGRRAGSQNGIYDLLRQALEHKKIRYEGDGEAVREYIHVEDAARLSVKILAPEFANRHLILTGHERWKIRDLTRMIAEMLEEDIEVEFGNLHVDGHYAMTPYAFRPRLGHKLVANDFVDLGQGLLDCMSEIHEELRAGREQAASGNTAETTKNKEEKKEK
ncbi:MAG: NAD(P)-dependent oxidoreductase [Candidatus Hydrogenedentota bacterium]|nr:MAG: NAD(P)-dependent oxidoreductase [Candidatus Hydrogenedentota bacterium]